MRNLFRFLLVAVLAGTAGIAAAQSDYRSHLLVQVMPASEAELQALYRLNLDVVPGETRMEPRVVALPEELEVLRQAGFRFEVIHENIERFYAERLGHRRLDTMGGYHTYSEIMTELDAVHAAHPTITTAKFSIGTTYEGRQLWVIKISDNPEVDEDEPEVFFNALIHAREPAAMECLLYTINYLTDNYSNPDVQNLVNNREIYFLPCANPDGYVYNETTNPNGGGMWRKNRVPIATGQYGVDLNRNFGTTWGLDNDGSTATPTSGNYTYRGSAVFSELETQAIRDFANAHHFSCQIDYHTYSNLVLIPWGTSYFDGDGLTEDNTTYEMIADSMAYWIHSVNGVWYSVGTPWQLLYNTNGGSFDWEYGERMSKPKSLAVSTEIGGSSDGFWPAQSRILPLSLENHAANMFMLRIASSLVPPSYAASLVGQCQSEYSGDGDGLVEPGETLSLSLTLKNHGRLSLSSMNGTLTSSDAYVTVVQGSSAWPTLAAAQSGANLSEFRVSVLPGCPPVHIIPFSLHVTSSGGLDTTIQVRATVGADAFSDDVESGVGGWTSGGRNNQWHVSMRRAESPTHSWFGGADAGNYSDNMGAWLMSDTLVLGPGASVSFDHWYNLENNYDVGYVEVDTGSGWYNVGSPITGVSGSWIHVVHDLGITCTGRTAQIRFRMVTDENTNAEGWYIDNIETCSGDPDIRVTPASITVSAPLGGTVSDTVYVCNDGGCPLSWSASYAPTSLTGPRDGGALDNQGGPDAFGYIWKDSNEPGGPTYSWVEIAGVGTACDFTSDDATLSVATPWPYTFYGVTYYGVVISANGNLHFGSASSSYDNTTIPSNMAPNALLAVFWDDLSPQSSGAEVYFYNDVANSRFIVQWDSVPHYGGGGRYTFEIILYQTGRIVYQYQSLTGTLNSCTVGIEDGDGAIGLPVVYNAAYLTNSLAIEFTTNRWLNYVPANGTVYPGQCQAIALDFSAGALDIGVYTGNLTIQNNDPDENPVVVPITFNVGSYEPPENVTAYLVPGPPDSLAIRWVSNGAPHYQVYSSPSVEGPFTTPVGSPVTGTSLMIPLPAEELLFYVVVARD